MKVNKILMTCVCVCRCKSGDQCDGDADWSEAWSLVSTARRGG